jgi:hypothetical protein
MSYFKINYDKIYTKFTVNDVLIDHDSKNKSLYSIKDVIYVFIYTLCRDFESCLESYHEGSHVNINDYYLIYNTIMDNQQVFINWFNATAKNSRLHRLLNNAKHGLRVYNNDITGEIDFCNNRQIIDCKSSIAEQYPKSYILHWFYQVQWYAYLKNSMEHTSVNYELYIVNIYANSIYTCDFKPDDTHKSINKDVSKKSTIDNNLFKDDSSNKDIQAKISIDNNIFKDDTVDNSIFMDDSSVKDTPVNNNDVAKINTSINNVPVNDTSIKNTPINNDTSIKNTQTDNSAKNVTINSVFKDDTSSKDSIVKNSTENNVFKDETKTFHGLIIDETINWHAIELSGDKKQHDTEIFNTILANIIIFQQALNNGKYPIKIIKPLVELLQTFRKKLTGKNLDSLSDDELFIKFVEYMIKWANDGEPKKVFQAYKKDTQNIPVRNRVKAIFNTINKSFNNVFDFTPNHNAYIRQFLAKCD